MKKSLRFILALEIYLRQRAFLGIQFTRLFKCLPNNRLRYWPFILSILLKKYNYMSNWIRTGSIFSQHLLPNWFIYFRKFTQKHLTSSSWIFDRVVIHCTWFNQIYYLNYYYWCSWYFQSLSYKTCLYQPSANASVVFDAINNKKLKVLSGLIYSFWQKAVVSEIHKEIEEKFLYSLAPNFLNY